MAFLGILDEKIKIIDQHEQCSWMDNKIGGQPIFSPGFDVTKLMENDRFQCTECSNHMVFILQIYCPIDDSNDDRILYFFSCVNKNCSNKQCRLFRIVTKEKQTMKKMETKLFDDDWGDDGQSLINDSTLTESSSESIITKKYDFEKYSHFIPHYISVIDEPSNESIDKEKYEKIAKQIVIVEENNSITEEYEKHYPEAFKNDKDNYRFYKQLRKCPEQIMRYEWSGKPLKPSNKANIETSEPCKNCGSTRVFEVQLMPSLINILWNNKKKTIENDDDTSLDFETILFYTCGRNCNRTDNIHEEQVFVFKENCPTLNEQSFEFIPEQKNQKTK